MGCIFFLCVVEEGAATVEPSAAAALRHVPGVVDVVERSLAAAEAVVAGEEEVDDDEDQRKADMTPTPHGLQNRMLGRTRLVLIAAALLPDERRPPNCC